MDLAEPRISSLGASWKARLELGFTRKGGRTVLAKRAHDGPLVVQKPLYPEGDDVCHAIIVHPPGGIAAGDELELQASVAAGGHSLLTTPGAAKWYRSSGAWAAQRLHFAVAGALEWLPRETIVYNGARATLGCSVELMGDARYIGWEILCLGRSGAGERFDSGEIQIDTRISRDGKLLWLERGQIAGGRLMDSPAGLGGHSVCGTLVATAAISRAPAPSCLAVTALPGLLIARYLGDSGEEAMRAFTELWTVLRPRVASREAVEPRIWRT